MKLGACADPAGFFYPFFFLSRKQGQPAFIIFFKHYRMGTPPYKLLPSKDKFTITIPQNVNNFKDFFYLFINNKLTLFILNVYLLK